MKEKLFARERFFDRWQTTSLFTIELGRVNVGGELYEFLVQVFKSHTLYYFLDSFMHFKFFCALLNLARVRRCKSRESMKVTSRT